VFAKAEEGYLLNTLYVALERSNGTNAAASATVRTSQQNIQTYIIQPEVCKRTVSTCLDEITDAPAATNNADVSLISSTDTCQLLQMEDMHISGIRISNCEFDHIATNVSATQLLLILASNMSR